MECVETSISDVVVIKPRIFQDDRGYFFESFNLVTFEQKLGAIPHFVQDNESRSAKGTIRGLHLQMPPYAQSKLVRVIVGKVMDVAVDCRPDSSSYGQAVCQELSGENKHQMWIPEGFAHGFQVLSDECILSYKVTAGYAPSAEVSINPFDQHLGIPWQKDILALMSEKDRNGMDFSDFAALNAG